MSTSQVIVQVCLFLVAAIALFGGALQLFLGQPVTAAPARQKAPNLAIRGFDGVVGASGLEPPTSTMST